ncbi:MAG: potassium transporter Kup, partial [Thermoanaerobaculia bacterium]
FQKRGTGGIGAVFGPVVLLWFGTIAVLGGREIIRSPKILLALNPWYGLDFFFTHNARAFFILGSVVLAITGAEALYADLGHFGKRPIRLAFFLFVLPALLLNYFGQGALLLSTLGAPDGVTRRVAENPFFHLVGDHRWALYPLVALATMATVIASQAVISGAFSLTRQAVQLGYMPRVAIIHTSEEEIGQIYIPSINWLLMISTIGLVLGFQRSTNLAAAYGVAVTATMAVTTLLAEVVARRLWGWSPLIVIPGAVFFLAGDLGLFGANIIKVLDGGWFPLAVGLVVYTLLSTWKKGRSILSERLKKGALPFSEFIGTVTPTSLPRVPGTAVFMSRDPESTPTALLHNLKHNKVLHEKVVLLTVMTEEFPYVEEDDRVRVEDLGKGFFRVIARYGFLQNPGVSEVIDLIKTKGLDLNVMNTTFFLSRETLIPSKQPGMALWREKLFAVMSRNAQRPTDFFRIPPNRVVELGMQVRL